jgi:hypothetical protein
VTDKPSIFSAPTDDTHRDFSQSDLRDVHDFWGGWLGLDEEQTREVFPEDQIQLIGIEARVFDHLPDLETERQYRLVQVRKKVCVPFSAPNRRCGSPSGNLNLWVFEDLSRSLSS